MSNPYFYSVSRLGQTNEAIKIAYMAGKRIFILVTRDYSIGIDIIKQESILPLKRKYANPADKTSTPSNFFFAKHENFFGNQTNLKEASIFVYSGEKFPEPSLKAFVDALQGYTSLDGGNVNIGAIRKSVIFILTSSAPKGIPQEITPYMEIINVPLLGKEEFDVIVSEWLNRNEGLPLITGADGLKKISDLAYLERLYHNLRGLSPIEIDTILNGLKARRGRVYYSLTDRNISEFEKILSEIRKDAERIISKVNALSLKDTADAPSPAGLRNVDKWLEDNGKRICNPEHYERDYAMQPPRGIIVSGVPGSGKSMMARHIAKTLGRTLVRLDVGDAMGKFVGDTEKGISDALRAAEELSPCVLWIDEMEKAFTGGHEVTVRMIGKFLTWMQEKSDRGLSIFVFCTSNDISKMPPEMFRSGRFDEKYSIFMPSAQECGEIFQSQISHQCSQYQHSRNSNIVTKKLFDSAAINGRLFVKILNSADCIPAPREVTDTNYTRDNKFFTGADIAGLIEKAKNIYILKYSKSSSEYVFESDKFIQSLKEAVKETRTYGETNLDDIVKCFVQLKKNNFFSASSDVVMPYEGYDEIRYNMQMRQHKSGSKHTPTLYSLDDEAIFLQDKCLYDKQLYISVRNAINHLADKLTAQQ